MEGLGLQSEGGLAADVLGLVARPVVCVLSCLLWTRLEEKKTDGLLRARLADSQTEGDYLAPAEFPYVEWTVWMLCNI